MSIFEEATQVRAKLDRFVRNDVVPIGVAQRLISDSAWWYGHPRGPVHAPKHYENVTAGHHGWELAFGANAFLVEKAIRRCIKLIGESVALAEKNAVRVDGKDLRQRLALQVRGSVANFEGNEYDGLYNTSDGFMHFGTQAINVNDFVDTIWKLAEIHRIAS